MKTHRFFFVWLITVFCLLLPPSAMSQPYRFAKILDTATGLRPDGAPFGISFAPTTPAFDGKWVVFRDPGPNNDPGTHAVIYSYNTLDKSIRSLVDLTMSVPGGGARFQDLQPLDCAPIVRNGTVIFVARDNSVGQNRQGLYSVPAAGGAIQMIANYNTPVPGGGTFTVFDASGSQVGAFSFDGANLAFNAQGNGLGNYWAKPDGSSLGLVADSSHPLVTPGGTVMNFYAPTVIGNNVVMIGTGAADPRTGYNGIYVGSMDGSGTVRELLNSNQRLPDNPNTNFHTRFDSPVLAFDGTLVAFRADDANANFSGLYTTDLTSQAINKIVDVNSTLTGLGKIQFIALSAVSAEKGAVLFRASDTTGNNALFLWKRGAISRIVGRGDQLDGRTVQDFTDPGPAAVSGTTFVFNADFGGGIRGLYLATEIFASTSAASYDAGAALAPSSIVAGYGQALATGSEATATQPPPTTLANTTVKVRDSAGVERQALLYFVSSSQINYVIPDGTAVGRATVTVTSGATVTATGSVTVDPVAPGLFTANFDGRGVPAANAISVASDQTQTLLAVARCGATAGSCVPTPIDLGPAGTRVILALYGTGIRGRSSLAAATAQIGGTAAVVEYAGPQPQYSGMDQVNVAIPRSLAGRGEVDLLLTVDGKPANAVRVNIK
jgi:uncharacterized protein (TIGR03437 family)